MVINKKSLLEYKLSDTPVLILDCQTTGASPVHGNVLEIAYRVHHPKARSQEFCNSYLVKQPEDQPIPPRIERLTGITNDDLEDAVSAKSVIKELKKTFNTLPPVCVIHFSRFELPFLLDLFERFGNRKTLPFETICTFEIARRLYPNLPSRGIRAIAGFLGIELHELKRAGSHVNTTYDIWDHLVEKLSNEQVITYKDLGEFLQSKPEKRNGKLEYPLEKEKRLNLPDAPGVYRMLNRQGKILYVGKATSLKSRVNSHFRGRKKKTSKSFELLTQVMDIKVTICESPLESAIIENDQIKIHDPAYNTSLKANDRNIWFYSSDFNSISNKQSKKCPVGPFPNASIVDDVLVLSDCLTNNLLYEEWLYGIDDSDLISDGLDLFVEQYLDELLGDFSARNLLSLGMKLFRRKKNYLRSQLEDEDEDDLSDDDLLYEEVEEVEEEEVELTPYDVLARLESMLVYFARSYLRAKELTRLLNARASFTFNQKQCSIQFKDGTLFDKQLKRVSKNRKVYPWNKLDIVSYDRMRVFSSEITRMLNNEESIEVEPNIYILSRW